MKDEETYEGEEMENEFVADEQKPLIPEGEYQAECIKIDKGRSHSNAWKLFLKFKIYDWMNLDDNPILFMAMNYPTRKVPTGSKYYKNWVIANHNKVPKRGDRMPVKIFKFNFFKVRVRTVKPKYPDGKLMPECFHYSVVDFLIERETGAPN